MLGLLGAMAAADSNAALDAPGAWSPEAGASEVPGEVRESDLASAPWNLWQAHMSDDSSDKLLDDSEDRIPALFDVPREMRDQVRFWLQIYTKYSSREAVIFDEEHPELVYEVVDFRNLARTARNRAAYEIVSRQALRARVAAYQAALIRLSKSGIRPGDREPARGRKLSQEERALIRAVRGHSHRHQWAALKRGLRVQWGQRDQVIQGLLASAPHRARMDHVFQSMDLPPELTLLALVESSFNTRALSHAGAAGVWQFMPDSGAEFLRVDRGGGVDERVSPIKSTVAAARLLQRNFRMLGSWPAAISAYNHGHGKWIRVSRRERVAPGRFLTQCSHSRGVPARLGFASRNYYAEFLALLRAERYQETAFGPAPSDSGRAVRFVRVTEPERIDALAQRHGLAPQVLLSLNPDLLSSHLPVARDFLLAVPATDDDFTEIIAATRRRERSFHTSRAARKSALQAANSRSTPRRRRG
jgi:membrane-bound lytic murein transglycosylase D